MSHSLDVLVNITLGPGQAVAWERALRSNGTMYLASGITNFLGANQTGITAGVTLLASSAADPVRVQPPAS